jgi:hypothetical protein
VNKTGNRVGNQYRAGSPGRCCSAQLPARTGGGCGKLSETIDIYFHKTTKPTTLDHENVTNTNVIGAIVHSLL